MAPRSTRWYAWLAVVATLLVTRTVRAEVFLAPIGGRAFTFGDSRVLCGAPPPGWTVEAGGRALRPPLGKEAIGKVEDLTLAASPAQCTNAGKPARAVATGKLPVLERSSISLYVDEGRIEADGTNLEKSLVSWPGEGNRLDSDTCSLSPEAPGTRNPTEHCIWSVSRTLPIDPAASPVRLWPRGSLVAPDAMLFDEHGRVVAPASMAVTPKKVQIASFLPTDAAIDVSAGFGLLPITHADAVADVECRGTTCRLEGGQLRVKAPPEGVSQIEARFTVAPGIVTKKPGPVVSKIAILRCPMEPVSGDPFRGLPSARVIVKLGASCARDVDALRFYAGTHSVDVSDKISVHDETYAVLSLGSVDASHITLTAVRTGSEGAVVASANLTTRVAPSPRSVLEIPGYPGVDFVPYNREAIVHLPRVAGGEFVLLPVEGVYSVRRQDNVTYVQGDRNAAGLATFVIAFRATSLPKPLSEVNLATFLDPLQRRVREANEPAPFGTSTKMPLAEVLCNDSDGRPFTVPPGDRVNISFRQRISCRLVLHRERISERLGAQRIHVEIEVRQLDGTLRSEASVNERMVLRHGPEPKVAWIKGVQAQYDNVVVRLTHENDENHYLGGEGLLSGAPSLQWSMVFGTGRFRLYATSAIPTGLYRFGGGTGSGALALNFGVLSRLTWLNRDGKEGVLGLEAGIMAFGLTGPVSTSGESLTQVGAVLGAGLSIPIANASQATQAAINLHGWLEQAITTSGAAGVAPRAFIFGPSISIGNVGGTF